MIKKVISTLGLIGVLLIIIFGVIDHLSPMKSNIFFVSMGAAFALFVPMLIREILSLIKEDK